MELIIVEYLIERNAPVSAQGVSIHLSQRFRTDVSLKDTRQALRRCEKLGTVEKTKSGFWVPTQVGAEALRKQKQKQFSANKKLGILPGRLKKSRLTAPERKDLKRSHMWAQNQVERNGGEYIEPADQFLPR